jgi:hypothetical protein
MMTKTKLKKQQLKDEITNLYNVFLKNKVKQWEKHREYHCDIAEVYLMTNCIVFHFKDISLYLNYDGKIATEDSSTYSYHKVYPYTYTVSELRTLLKLLKRFVLYMI